MMSKPDEKNNAKMSCAFHSAGVTGGDMTEQ